MDSVIDMEGARRLVADAALWPLVRDFLWDFGPQIHPSRLPDGIKTLAGQSTRIRKYALDTLGVTPAFHDFPQTDNSRLLLFPSEKLVGMAKWLGALACSASLRKIMDGAKVRALKAALPEIYPAVFSYTAYFRNIPQLEAASADEVVNIGYKILFSVVSSVPEALLKRLVLKLPTPVDLMPQDSEIPKFQNSAISLLLKLRFPEAYALCCS